MDDPALVHVRGGSEVGGVVMLGDDITAALPELRAHAASMMLDACRIERVIGSRFDRVFGVDVEDMSVVYAGPCRLKSVNAQPRSVQAGPVEWTVAVDELHLPVVGSGNVRPGDVATITGAELDQGLVGRRFVISGTPARTAATARRFRVEEVSG